jgi:hypothetical protein
MGTYNLLLIGYQMEATLPVRITVIAILSTSFHGGTGLYAH